MLPRALGRSILVGLVSLTSACVLPIAPEFQDPPASVNFEPTFVDTDPPAGSIVTANPTATFKLVLQDQNVNDDLHVRFIFDFPPLSDATSAVDLPIVVHSPTGQLLDAQPFTPDCRLHRIAPGSVHQLFVVVADRPFDLPGSPPDFERLPPDAKKNTRSWTLNMDCSVQNAP
jgi:hypothetical protein